MPFGRWAKKLRSRRSRCTPRDRLLAHRVAVLENRLLLAAASDFGNPRNFTAVDDKVFFSAEFSTGERRLGVTDGTAAGTKLLAAFAAGSYLQDFVALSGKLYFVANDGIHGYELWMSDGTSAGTQMVVDINPGPASACFPDASDGLIRTAVLNGVLCFGADDGIHGQELWRTDGTAAGTSIVVDLNPGSSDGLRGEMLAIGNAIYFAGSVSSSSGWDLCKTDGTAAATGQIKDLPGLGLPANLTNVDGTLYFAADSPSGVRTLWKSDGTNAGTVNFFGAGLGVPRLYPDPIVNGPPPPYRYLGRPFGVLNGSIIFAAYTSVDNVELWTSDGTTAGTVLLKEINTSDVMPGSNPGQFVTIGNTVYFTAYEPASEFELWKTDGTTAGTVLVRDVLPPANGSNPKSLINFNGVLYYSQLSLRKSDGTFSGTVGVKGVSPDALTVIGNRFYFSGNGELWISDGTTAGTVQIVDLTDPANPNNHLPPTNISLSTPSAPEGLPANRSVGFFVSTDPEPGDTFTYSLVAGTGDEGNGSFEIVGNQLRKTAVFDYETKDSYSVRIRSTDQWGAAYEEVFVIRVTDVNERPSISVTPEIASVAETSTGPLAVGNIIITDDALGTNNLSLTGIDAEAFEIAGTSLQLKSGVALNAESAKRSFTVTVNVDDPAFPGIESSFDFVLNVADVSEFDVTTPIDNDAAADSVAEDASVGTIVGITTFAFDGDATNNAITWSLTDDAAGRFTIDPVTGVVSVANASLLNREAAASHSITVQAVSADGSASIESFTIDILDVDEFNVGPVTDSNGQSNSIPENSSGGAPVGMTAFASDGDATDNSITYSLTDDAGGRFQVDPVTGVVTVRNLAAIDFEAAQSLAIVVKATSQDGSFTTQPFNISVTDVDESNVGPITDTDPAPNSVPENSPAGTPVGVKAFASDADGTNSGITYSLWNTHNGRFAIDPVTGVVKVGSGPLLNREAEASWAVTVLATSQDGSISVKEFIVQIADVNEFKVGTISDTNPAANSIVENCPNGTLVGVTGLAVDADATTSRVTYSLFNTRGGRFAINPTTGVVTVVNGSLIDRESGGAWTITIIATSQDGSVSVRDFVIGVQDVDEYDVGQVFDLDPAANSVPENSPAGTTVGITGFGIDLDATHSAVGYSLTDNAGGRFAINSSTGVVTVAAGAILDREAAASWPITIQAKSADGSVSTRPFTVQIADADEFDLDQVTDADVTANTVAENSPAGTLAGITAKATDGDATNNTVTYSLTNSAGNRFQIHSVTGVVSVAPGATLDFESQTAWDITVKATSSDGSFSTQTFTIALINVFDAPRVTLSNNTVAENRPSGTVVGALGSADVNVTSPVYTLVSGTGSTDNTKFSITGNQLKTKAGFNFEAKSSYSIRVQMKGAGGVLLTQVFTVLVTNVNERPTGLTLSPALIVENNTIGATVGTLSGVDPDAGETLNYTLVSGSGSTDNGKFVVEGNQLKAAVVFDYETKRSCSIRVRVTDAAGLTYEKTLTIKVTNGPG